MAWSSCLVSQSKHLLPRSIIGSATNADGLHAEEASAIFHKRTASGPILAKLGPKNLTQMQNPQNPKRSFFFHIVARLKSPARTGREAVPAGGR